MEEPAAGVAKAVAVVAEVRVAARVAARVAEARVGVREAAKVVEEPAEAREAAKVVEELAEARVEETAAVTEAAISRSNCHPDVQFHKSCNSPTSLLPYHESP